MVVHVQCGIKVNIIVSLIPDDVDRNLKGEDEFGAWSTSGCKEVKKNGNERICSCTQLAHFGMLFVKTTQPYLLRVSRLCILYMHEISKFRT